MEYSVNTRPLLQQSESDSDFEEGTSDTNSRPNIEEDEHVVITKDSKPLFKIREPNDR